MSIMPLVSNCDSICFWTTLLSMAIQQTHTQMKRQFFTIRLLDCPFITSDLPKRLSRMERLWMPQHSAQMNSLSWFNVFRKLWNAMKQRDFSCASATAHEMANDGTSREFNQHCLNDNWHFHSTCAYLYDRTVDSPAYTQTHTRAHLPAMETTTFAFSTFVLYWSLLPLCHLFCIFSFKITHKYYNNRNYPIDMWHLELSYCEQQK